MADVLRLVEATDLEEGIAESEFSIYRGLGGRVHLEPEYYHSDISCQLDTYEQRVEKPLKEWLTKNTHYLSNVADILSVVYTYDTKNEIATNFKVRTIELEHEE